MTGILAFGAYVPRLRLQRSAILKATTWFNSGLAALGGGERALANWDEDCVTMAVEAARDCLQTLPRDRIATMMLASTSAPFADRQNAGIVKEALNLRDEVCTLDIAGSQKAGTGALIQALYAAAGGECLCVASERRHARAGSEAELVNGDAAAAFLVGTECPVARFVGSHSIALDFVDHFRGHDAEFDYGWESRWVREEGYGKIAIKAVKDALAKCGIDGTAVAHLIVPIPAKGVASSIARAVGIRPEAVRDGLGATVGNAGCAHPLLMLSHALERASPGDILVVLGFGQGCDVLLFEVTDAIGKVQPARGVSGWLARRRPEDNYVKHLAFAGLLQLERGMRAEQDQKPVLTALYRNRKSVLGLVGSRDRDMGVVQFPRTPIGVAATASAFGVQDDYPLAERPARILTYTADNLTYAPDPPAWYGTVEFEGGGRMVAEFADVDAELIEVGRPMRMMFRIKAVDEQRGFTKYFWKAAPVDADREG